jgi:hypothetical protein
MRRVGAPHGLDRRTFKLAEGHDPDFYALPSLKFFSLQRTSLSDDKAKSCGIMGKVDLKNQSASFNQKAGPLSMNRTEATKEGPSR